MNIDGPNDETFRMEARGDLVHFVYALQDDLKQNPQTWDNRDLQTFLGALARFLNDAHGYYRNEKLEIDPDLPSWRLFADCLQAASCYD